MSQKEPLSIGAAFARGVLTTSISQVAVIVLSVVTAITQARMLGTEGRGDVARFVNMGALVVLYFGLGIASALTYFMASGQVPRDALTRVLRPVFVLTVLGVVVFIAVLARTPLESLLPQSLPIAWVIALFGVFFALSQGNSWIAASHAARGYFTAINVSAVCAALVASVVSVGLLVVQPAWAGAATIIWLIVIAEGVRAVVLVAYGFRSKNLGPISHPNIQPLPFSFAAMWRYSALSFFADAVLFMTYRFDMWVVDAYHGASELGLYAVAVTLAQLVWIIPTAAGRVLFPFTASMEESAAAELARRAAKITFLIAVVLAAVGWIASLVVLPILLGEEFARVPELLGILLIGVVPFSVAKVLGNYLAGRNALVANVGASCLVLAVTIVLDLLLIPGYGAVGAAWATAVSYIAYTLLLLAIFIRRTRGSRRVEVLETTTGSIG